MRRRRRPGSVEGTITDFASQARFKVDGQLVDAMQARFENGVASDLANGRRVGVIGTVTGGVLVASKVEFKSAPPATTLEVEGAITRFRRRWRISRSRASRSTRRRPTISSGTVADLANGRKVGVVGHGQRRRAAGHEGRDQGCAGAHRGQRQGHDHELRFGRRTSRSRRASIDASAAKFEHGTRRQPRERPTGRGRGHLERRRPGREEGVLPVSSSRSAARALAARRDPVRRAAGRLPARRPSCSTTGRRPMRT